MGADCADLDGDGLVDLLTTTYQDEMPVLYKQIAPGLFEDHTHLAKIAPTLYPHVTWGVGLVDFDNDGDKDIYIACGHFLDNIRQIDDRTDVKVQNYLLANDGRGQFTDVSSAAGNGMEPVESSRAAAFDDLDLDGQVDAVILNSDAPATIISNQTCHRSAHSKNQWLSLDLVGTVSNRSAAGAEVSIALADGKRQKSIVHLGRGYQSHYGTRLHFGLGITNREVSIEVRWPSGLVDRIPVATLNKIYKIIEGTSKAELIPLRDSAVE
jgi:hypothetical protein